MIVAVATKAEAQTSALAVADSLYAIGEYTGVIDKLEQVKDKSSKVYLMLARSHSAKGTLEDALANYKMAATGTDQAIAMTGYGKMLITKKKYKEADSVFTDLILAYAKNPNFYYQRGRAREKLRFQTENDTLALEGKVFSEATKAYLDDFKKTIALDSTHQKALAELASYHLKRKDYEQVEKLCKKALQSYPENVEVINLLAQNYFYKGWNKEAEDWFEKLIALGTETQFIYEKLGMSYYKDHYYDKAIDAYNKALQYSEEDWHLHGILAKLYNFTRDFEKAESHGKMALFFKDLPLDEDYYTLANTYRIHKKWLLAMEYINKALAENPDLEAAVYGKAVIADNYYEDKEAVLKLYESYVERFDKPYGMPRLAKERISQLKTEIFMSDDKDESN
ncbi:MAG: hypothetical protein CL868_10215 [Cytophagaceae bacterium]|nr:hypothetical protein [Cytophagaceae bacterium]